MINELNDLVKERLLEEYTKVFVKHNNDTITKLRLGFVEEDCSIPAINIIINCIENIEIFNNEQLNNLSNYLNKLSYV